jgi:aldose 1-epimerase
MTPDGIVKLAAGPLELWLAPGKGGSIARFDRVEGDARTALLRGSDGVPADILDAANFPIVPFVNRIRGGRFEFRDREIGLAPNMPGDPSPLHGQGWRASWTVETASDETAELRFLHEEGEWPWAYEARQSFTLDGGGVDVRLACRNMSREPMPCGLGQHPYFPCNAQTRIDTEVSHVWTIDEQVLPVEKVPATGRFALRDRAVCGQDLDHGFAGWSGSARIRTPGENFEIILSSPQARFFQLYSPPGGGLFVAEPVTHANGAMNAPEEEWTELGFRVLEPGEEMVLDMRLDVRGLQAR